MWKGNKNIVLLFIICAFAKTSGTKIVVDGKCNLDDEIIEVYTSYFQMARTVMITQLTNNETNNADGINDLVDLLGRHITRPKIFRHIDLDKGKGKMFFSKHKIFAMHHRSYYIILVEDGDELKKFITTITKWKCRLTFVIIFATSDKTNCKSVMKGISSSLAELSKKYNIFNIIAHAPCSCHPNLFYRYLPFKRTAANNFGAIKKINIDRIVHHNRSHHWKYNRKLKNFNGWPIKVYAFRRMPTIMTEPNELFNSPSQWDQCNLKCGIDANVLINLSKYLNFTIVVNDDPHAYYGTFYKNGFVTGALGKVMRKEVDFAANSRFVDVLKRIEYSIPIDTEKMCVVVPKALKKPSWTAIFNCFNIFVWLLIFIIEVLSLVFWQMLQKARYSWMVIYGISITVTTAIPKNSRFKYLLVAFMMYSLVISTIFQGNLVKSYGSVQYYSDMTVNDFINSKIKIYTSYIHIFDDIENDDFKILKTRIVDNSGSNISNMYEIERGNNRAALVRKTDAKFMINAHFLDSAGNPKLHVISECPRSFFLAYTFPEESPYIWEFNRVLIRLVEGGLISKWKDFSTHSLNRQNSSWKYDNQARSLPLLDIIYAFYILTGGSIVAIAIFILEIYIFREDRLDILQN